MKPLVLTAAMLLVFVFAWFAYDKFARQKSCEAIFEQSAPSLSANLEIINIKGGVTIGRQQVQALTQSSQNLGLNLRNCCVAHKQGQMSDSQYQACLGGTKRYEAKVRDVKNDIERSQTAAKDRDPDRAAQYAARAQRIAELALTSVELPAQPIPLPTPSTPTPSSAPLPPPITHRPPRADAAVGGGPRSPTDEDAAPDHHAHESDGGSAASHDAGDAHP